MKITVQTLMAGVKNVNGHMYSKETLEKIMHNSKDEIKFRKILLFATPINGNEVLDFRQVVGFVTDCFMEMERLCFRISLFRPETGYNDALKTGVMAICPQIGGADVNNDEIVDANGIYTMNLGTYALSEVAEYYKDSIKIEEE